MSERRFLVAWAIVIVAAIGLVGSVALLWALTQKGSPSAPMAPMSPRPTVSRTLPDFRFVDQAGSSRSLADWRDQVLLVQFVFVECPGPCPLMTKNFATLQRELLGHPGIALLSVSVNPKRDTPERLHTYGVENGANFQSWTFARAEEKAVRQLVAAMNGDPEMDLLEHSTKTFLIDPSGAMRRFYDIKIAAERAELIEDAKRLLRGENLQ